MVFEFLPSLKEIKNNALLFFAVVFGVTTLSIFISYLIFPEESSLLFLFFIVVTFLPTFRSLILLEEKILEKTSKKSFLEKCKSVFTRNYFVISIYAQLFIGIIISSTFWFLFLPEKIVLTVFKQQISTVQAITGAYISPSHDFFYIFWNNFKVLTISFLLSFLFGTGALFIISWNASVVATFLGTIAREMLEKGSDKLSALFYSILFGGSSLLLHGIPEVLAYFIAGVAGGVLSVGIYRKAYTREILEDSFIFYVISVLLLLIAAFLESML